jgi:hypothetical protein
MAFKFRGPVAAALIAGLSSAPAMAAGLDLAGSLGEGGFSRYVPPVTNPLFNETPFITTEVKPIYIYHDLPNDFITDGGNVNVVALQARLAITDRLGFIATSDGYTWLDFNDNVSDDDGFNDIAAGLKYAVLSDPAAGRIFSVGARYTFPVGTLDADGLDLNGFGDGFVDVFATGAQLFGKAQVQGSAGFQIAVSEKNWSFFHGSLHGDYEILPGFFPLIEANILVPVDGGNRLGVDDLNLTGTDIIDFGADDPETILTLAAGMRFRISDNMIFGAAFEKNVLENDIDGTDGTEAGVTNWRVTADVTIHF